ncbi:MAG: hypothetical protein OXG13_12380 [Gemmatimonadaceae bacterium]|nr:hypothetical protein [Gemmatimonadaceae bacterium]
MLTGGEAMKEVLPGLFQWRIVWPEVWSLESWWLRTEAGSVLIDPVEWSALQPIAEAGDVRAIVLTVGWHERSARLFAARTGAPIYLPAEDACMVEDLDRWEPYGDGDELPCGLRAVGVPGLTRGEQALLSPRHGGLLFVGDALGTTAKWAPGGIPLGGHPNGHPRPWESLSHLLDLDFESLLPGHGDPIVGGARETLREMMEERRSTSTGPPRVTWFPKDRAP